MFKNLLILVESLLWLLVYIALIFGTLLFLFFGLMDITGTTNIGSLQVIVGILGVALCAANALGFFALHKKKVLLQLLTASVIVVLSIAFSHYTPIRLGAFFLKGDPGQFAATWSGVTGGVLALLALAQKVTGRTLPL